MKKTLLMLALAAATLPLGVWANIEWRGGSSGNWDDSANWSGTVEPHRFHYDTMKGAAATVTFRNAEALTSGLWVENGLDGVVTFTADSLDKGLTQTKDAGNVNIGTGTQGALAISGGTYHFANDIVVGNGSWNENARGDFVLNSGRAETHYWMVLGVGTKANAQGNVTVSGGELVVGCRTNEVGVYVTADNGRIEMGRAAGSVTTFMQTGGNVSSQFDNGPALIVGSADNTTATYTISNGTYTARSGNVLIANGTGSIGTLNICGGTFTAETITNGLGTATVNLDGGTLAANADGTLIASGVTLKVGDTESTIELTGQTVTIDGNVTGGGGDNSTSGVLKVKGWGKLIVTGKIQLDTLTVSPNDYSLVAGDNFSLTVDAASVFVRHLYGAGTITTRAGVNTGDGAFYGKVSGAGGFRTRGATTLYGLHDYAGSVTFADNASLSLVSSLDGISPLWRVDASDVNSITTNAEGKVTAWASKVNSYAFSNTDSQMTVSDAYFGGKQSVLTQNSSLACPIGGNDSIHGKALIGVARIVTKNGKSVDQWGGPMLYFPSSSANGAGNIRIGERSSQGYWTKQTGGSSSDEAGIWQNGSYGDKTFYYSEKIQAFFNFPRFASTYAENIGGFHSNIAIGEYMGFTYNPSTAQRKQIETYLANKWNITGMGKSLPEVAVVMGSGCTLDLGGLDVTASSFNGCGVVSNGTLRTVDGKVTQGDGSLTIPAVDGTTYTLCTNDYQLIITGASGKSVTIVVPDERVGDLDGRIFCEGDGVTFKNTSGATLDMSGYRNKNGWWASGSFSWTGGSSGEVKYWNDAENWSGSDVPYRFQYSKLNGAAQTVTFNSAETIDGAIWIENGLDGAITFTAESGEYGVTQEQSVTSNINIGTGNYGALVIDGGRYHFANDILLGIGTWADNARGDMFVTSGRVETEYWLVLGTTWDDPASNGGWHTGAQGNFTIEGGELVVGCRKDGNGNYVIADNGNIELGRAAGSTGTLNIFGGTVTAQAIIKGAGTAIVNIDGGTLAPTASGTFIASGIALNIGENGATINLTGQDIVIDGDLAGDGQLLVTGYGSVTVNGAVSLAGLAFEPWNVSETVVNKSSQYTLKLTADSVSVATLDGGAVIETAHGVTAQSGTFFGTIGGEGGFTKTGSSDAVMTLKGISRYAGDLKIQKGVFSIASYLTDDMIYYDLDASNTGKWVMETSDGVTYVNSMAGSVGLTFVPMYDTTSKIKLASSSEYFGGKPVMMLSEGSAYRPNYSGVWLRGKRAKSVFAVYQNNTVVTRSGNSPDYDYAETQCIFDSGNWNDTIRFGAHNYQGSGVIAQRREYWYGFSNYEHLWATTKNRWANHTWPLFIDGSNDRSYVPGKISVLRFTDTVATSSNRHDVFGRYEHTFNGAVAEVLGLNDWTSLEAYTAIEAYLMNKWSCDEGANYTYIPNVDVVVSSGATLDLGGFNVSAASFYGAGTIKNGTLRTSDNTYRQGKGKLTITAVDGGTYIAAGSDYKLEVTGGAGKSVTIHIPEGWLGANANTYTYITCDASNVAFTFEGDALEYTDMGDGRYRFGSAPVEPEEPEQPEESGEYDFGEYGTENALDNANEESQDDNEAGLAFPGAYGWGRFAVGARASSSPTIYHVTNLKDSGTGSLRDAVSKPNRIIVFDVSGVIKISSRITFSSNLYVAGQTAPGEGITVYGNGCSFSGASNIICRYLRWRMGHIGSSGKDCAGIANGANMIFDHCSFSWGLDETFSINPDGKGTYPHNITLQNCIFGQGLMTHSAGGLMQADYVTLFRNLYVDNSTRNNKVKGINQYANNIVYNWKNGCYIMGGDSSGASYCTIESSLFINGPVSGNANALGGGNSDFHFYGNDNWQDKNQNGVLDASIVTHNGGGDSVAKSVIENKVGTLPALPLYAGNTLLENNLRKVGASLPYRDQSDCYMIDEVRTVGRSGGLITYEDTLAIGAPDTWDWWAGNMRTDSDNDGIPDEWEDAHGLNKNNYSDALAKTLDGTRLNIEVYINSITADSRQFFLRAPITLRADTATTKTIKLVWRDYTYGEIGFSIELLENGSWKQVGRARQNATSFTVGGLTPSTSYTFRVRAVAKQGNSYVYSEPAEVTTYTRQKETGEVDIDTYQPNVTMVSGGGTWNTSTTSTWIEGKAYANGDKVLLNTEASANVLVQNGSTAPESVVVNGTGVVMLNRACNLSGAMSLNKGNSGTLVLQKSTVNNQTKTSAATYTGKVVNHGGTIEFDTIANGGSASALGASTADALNWVFDGGTYKYTGSSASTDRNATFRKTSTLNIANSGTTLTMTGAMEGTGDFVLDGAGTLAIPDANTFFGAKTRDAIIRGGTLHLTTTGDSGSARNFANGNTIKNLHLAGGRVVFNSANEEYQTYSVPMYIEDGTVNEVTLATHCYMNSRLIGNGDVQFNISHVRAQFKSNMSDFTGTVTAHGNQTNSKYRPSFYHGSYWNYPKTRFNLTGTISMASKSRHVTCHIGGLSGESSATLSGSDTKSSGSGTTWYVGYANSNEEFAGAIDDYNSDRSAKGTTSVVKVGTGYWRLTGSSSHSGTTTVDEGSLIVDGSLPASSAVIVEDGGTLQGGGTNYKNIYGSVTVKSGGTLRAGDYLSTTDGVTDGFETVFGNAQLYLDGGVTLESGSRVVIPVARSSSNSNSLISSRLRPKSGSSFNIAEGVTLEFDLSLVDALEENETIAVFSLVPSFSGAFAAIEPATPGRGLMWDTSKLYTEKYVKVVKDPNYVPDMTPSTNDVSATVSAVSELDAYNALDIAVPSDVASVVDAATYKSYFKYTYKDNGNGTFDVAISGVADEIVASVVDSVLDALRNQTCGDDGCVEIKVFPGLYYATYGDTTPNIDALTERVLAWETSWRAQKQAGKKHYVRIDISPNATAATGLTSALAAVVFEGSGDAFAIGDVTPANGLPLTGIVVQEAGSTLPLTVTRSGDAFAVSPVLPGGATVAFELDAASTVALTCTNGTAFADGDALSLDALMSSVSGQTPVFEPAAPGKGLLWDASGLFSDMTLAVVVDPNYNPLPDTVEVANPVGELSSDDADAIVANAAVGAPSNATSAGLTDDDITSYTNLFCLVKRGPDTNGRYAVSAEMTADGTNRVAAALNEAVANAVGPRLSSLAAATDGMNVQITGIPGLWYSIKAGDAVTGRTEGDRTQAGKGGAVRLLFPHYDGSGFYEILVNIRKR